MTADKENGLSGRRIMVPPARPEANPLLHILQKHGAEVIEFPKLITAPPLDYGAMDESIRNLKHFDWIIFSGSNCVVNFFERLDELADYRADFSGRRIAAIGYGAVSALKKKGVEVNYIPKDHTSQGVIEGLIDIPGSGFLLVRVQDASRSLPDRLRELGAEVTEVDGYRMIVDTDADMAAKAFGSKFDAVALTNPTAVRFLLKGAEQEGFDLLKLLEGAAIAVVGPATAETAERLGLKPDIVSKGHIANLRDSLIGFFNDK